MNISTSQRVFLRVVLLSLFCLFFFCLETIIINKSGGVVYDIFIKNLFFLIFCRHDLIIQIHIRLWHATLHLFAHFAKASLSHLQDLLQVPFENFGHIQCPAFLFIYCKRQNIHSTLIFSSIIFHCFYFVAELDNSIIHHN